MPTVAEIKTQIVTQMADVEVDNVFDYEPTRWTSGTLLSVMTAGFGRRAIESPFQQGRNVVDPLGGRTWLWLFTLRLFVALKADGKVAQERMDDLVKQVVLAWEADASLGTLAVDSAITSGRVGKVEPRGSSSIQEMLFCEMEAVVEVTEEA